MKNMSTQPIKPHEEYLALVPRLSRSDFESLKRSIEKYGQYLPIVVNSEGVILDGYHRYKACIELGKEPHIARRRYENKLEEELFVIECNLKRRHLNSFQKGELALKSKPILEEIARRNKAANISSIKKVSSSKYLELGGKGVNEKIGKSVGLSHETIRKVETILESNDDDLKEKARKGQFTINEAFNKVKRSEKRISLLNEISQISSAAEEEEKRFELLQGDFLEQSSKIVDASVDLILTDPPYDEGSVPLYCKLAALASRVLKDGASLVTYISNFAMPEVLRNIVDNGLRYWWMFAVTHNGGHQLIYPRNIFAEWKPFVWFVKGRKPRDGLLVRNIGDLIESKLPDKSLHDWTQSQVEAEFVIDNLSVEGQLVLDPLMGIGTFGAAALKLKRRFIGIEIDFQHFELARMNLRGIGS
jgi:ParB-like chromosome segregation protein Spo0J